MAENVAKLSAVIDADCSGLVSQLGAGTAAIDKFHQANGKAASAFQAGSKAASRFGVVAGQAGYQVQDFAVQLAGGQNALVAFAQQGSQFLGVFGSGGAIAGAALAVGALVARLFTMGDAVKANTDYAKESTEAWDKYSKTIKDIQFKNLSPEGKVEDRSKRVAKLKEEQKVLSNLAYINSENIRSDFAYAASAEQYVFPTLEQQIKYQRAIEAARAKGESAPSPFNDKFGGGARSALYSFSGSALESMREQISKQQAVVAEQMVKLGDENRDDKVKKDEEAVKRRGKLEQEQVDFLAKLQTDASTKVNAALKRDDELRAQTKERILLKSDKMYALKKEATDIGRADLTPEQKQRALDQLVGPTSIPQAMQVNAGASALGGTYGDGAAVLDIQREVLKVAQQQRDAMNRMIQMWSTGSN
jgi:hypothetical protein